MATASVAGSPLDAHTESAIPFVFTGSGGEYFRIWIVNLLLTIVTFGVFSAWAKVRRLKYFYRNTQLAGNPFNYHGKPLAILTGRIVALVLLAVWHFTDLQSGSALAVLAIMLLVAPWLIVRALRFKLANSSWRGLRFGFTGSTRTAYLLLLAFISTVAMICWFAYFPFKNLAVSGAGGMLMALLIGLGAVLLLYLAVLPLGHYVFKRYQHSNSCFGTSTFHFDAGVKGFFKAYLVAIGFGFLSLIASGIVSGLFARRAAGLDPTTLSAQFLQFGLGLLILYLFVVAVGPYVNARVQNLVWNHTELDAHRFESTVSAKRLFQITLGNLVLTLLTLGLYKPFGVVRIVKYRVESMHLLPATDLDSFVSMRDAAGAAIGQEAAELFSIDIAL